MVCLRIRSAGEATSHKPQQDERRRQRAEGRGPRFIDRCEARARGYPLLVVDERGGREGRGAAVAARVGVGRSPASPVARQAVAAPRGRPNPGRDLAGRGRREGRTAAAQNARERGERRGTSGGLPRNEPRTPAAAARPATDTGATGDGRGEDGRGKSTSNWRITEGKEAYDAALRAEGGRTRAHDRCRRDQAATAGASCPVKVVPIRATKYGSFDLSKESIFIGGGEEQNMGVGSCCCKGKVHQAN